MRTMRRRGSAAVAATAALALTLAACGSDDGNGEEPDAGTGGETTESTDDGASAGGTITVGVHNGWPEGEAVSYLWAHILEEQGYTVELEYADAGPVFTALAQGDLDINFDTWLPITHEDYLEQYGDSWVDLGAWNDEASLTIAVNDDAPIESLTELADNADAFGNQIVGIESGAGLTRITQDEVIPTYGLEGMEFLISSTPAMLAELDGAIAAGENVVVTLWRPHWAYNEYPIRDLEDPEGALGETESMHTMAHESFPENFPEVAEWIEGWTLSNDELYELENIMFNENEGENQAASVEQWLESYPDYVDNIVGG